MPLEPTTPQNTDVQTTEVKSLTHFHVTQLNIMLDPNDAAAVVAHVTWSEGYMATTTFVPAKSHGETLSGQDVLDKIAEITDGTTSIYNNVKQAVWSLLQTRGLAPAGTIT